ncbi:MAG: bifunctional 4-hydroxy-2-oxoglutarate aldolase/2-dehydro-3-deoxy-phosphogluconate aldolase [Planctomycetales bacterium]|nr:bifunctional 4-hydroxy-2-oxoglutarate aldolase/2-dehydro-3-deoxy-phosphogluconate aldolase [Planctomycetales bacterium]
MTNAQRILDLVMKLRLIAIIRLADLSAAEALSGSLLRGGIGLQEFTLTNADALKTVSHLRQSVAAFDGIQAALGIGSIRSLEQAKAAHQCGAQYLVTPTVNVDVIRYCVEQDLAIVCGAFTPTEVLTAWDTGATAVKVFPARQLGPNYIRDVLAPLPEIRLIPTGGIDLRNMQQYLDAGAVGVGIGGNLVNPKLIENADWERVVAVANDYSKAARC